MTRPEASRSLSRRTFLAGTGMAATAVAMASCSRTSTRGKTGGASNPLAGVKGSTLSFGACLPLSGAFTIITKPWAAAMQYACDEVNEAGGLTIKGKKIKVEAPVIDSGYAAAPALASVQKLLSQGGRYVGGLVSEEAPVAVLGINEQANTLVTACINGLPELAPIVNRCADTLSGGQRQMLSMAMCLRLRPRMLLLDEPSSGLAPKVVAAVFEAVRRISCNGVSVLMVEQNAAQTLDLADTASLLESGRITISGPASDLANNAHIRAAYLGV